MHDVAEMRVAAKGADYALELARNGRRILFGGLVAGALAVGVSFLIRPTFTSVAVVLPPAQTSGAAASLTSSLGALANLAGGAGGGALRTPLDQYVALLGSTTVADRMVDRFKLLDVYDEDLRQDARKEFHKGLQVSAGRRDGLITISVDDHDPQRAQQMAAAMIDELRFMASRIAVTEAQQRRLYFEARVSEVRERLGKAQSALQAAGFAPGALKAEPKAAAESYAKLRAELATAEVRLQGLMSTFSVQAPEVLQQRAVVLGMTQQLRTLEAQSPKETDGEYLDRYRDFKYQEALFEQLSRQLELARVDEGREGGVVQVVDEPLVPEKKSRPKRAYIGAGVSVAAWLLLSLWVMLRVQWRSGAENGEMSARLKALWLAVKSGI